jgi:hypothetical protein
MQGLRAPADWIAVTFGDMTDNELNDFISQRFTKWTTEFQPLKYAAHLSGPVRINYETRCSSTSPAQITPNKPTYEDQCFAQSFFPESLSDGADEHRTGSGIFPAGRGIGHLKVLEPLRSKAGFG